MTSICRQEKNRDKVTTIRLSKETSTKLWMFKLENDERSMDDVILKLLEFWNAKKEAEA